MSSLSSQLNALRNQKTASSSHANAIGRGFGYTSNANASTLSKSALYKATIVHESSKVASDVPTSLVRAKCYDVLKSLKDLSLTLHSYAEIIAGPSTANQERALLTKQQVGLIRPVAKTTGWTVPVSLPSP